MTDRTDAERLDWLEYHDKGTQPFRAPGDGRWYICYHDESHDTEGDSLRNVIDNAMDAEEEDKT